MSNHRDPFAAAGQRAHQWLAGIADDIGMEDRQAAYRALRAWLYTVRDRLSVDAAAHLGAQLPELLRGIYFEGWVPSKVPQTYGADEFVRRFGRTAGVPEDEAALIAAAITVALWSRFSEGQLDHALAQLPRQLRVVLYGGQWAGSSAGQPETRPETPQPQRPPRLTERVERLEAGVDRLTEAIRTLAAGLEAHPTDEPTSGRAAVAARDAHRVLLAGEPT